MKISPSLVILSSLICVFATSPAQLVSEVDKMSSGTTVACVAIHDMAGGPDLQWILNALRKADDLFVIAGKVIQTGKDVALKSIHNKDAALMSLALQSLKQAVVAAIRDFVQMRSQLKIPGGMDTIADAFSNVMVASLVLSSVIDAATNVDVGEKQKFKDVVEGVVGDLDMAISFLY